MTQDCRYTLRMQKEKGGDVKDLLLDFGFAVSSIGWPSVEIKELSTRDWPGHDGKEAFVPERLRLQESEMEMELICRAGHQQAENRFNALLEWFLGDDYGAEFRLRDMWHRRSASGAVFKGISDIDYSEDNEGEYLSVTVTLYLFNPIATDWDGN